MILGVWAPMFATNVSRTPNQCLVREKMWGHDLRSTGRGQPSTPLSCPTFDFGVLEPRTLIKRRDWDQCARIGYRRGTRLRSETKKQNDSLITTFDQHGFLSPRDVSEERHKNKRNHGSLLLISNVFFHRGTCPRSDTKTNGTTDHYF